MRGDNMNEKTNFAKIVKTFAEHLKKIIQCIKEVYNANDY